jgi:hypothetical protein
LAFALAHGLSFTGWLAFAKGRGHFAIAQTRGGFETFAHRLIGDFLLAGNLCGPFTRRALRGSETLLGLLQVLCGLNLLGRGGRLTLSHGFTSHRLTFPGRLSFACRLTLSRRLAFACGLSSHRSFAHGLSFTHRLTFAHGFAGGSKLFQSGGRLRDLIAGVLLLFGEFL